MAQHPIGSDEQPPPTVVRSRSEALLWFSPQAVLIVVTGLLLVEMFGGVEILTELPWFLTMVGFVLLLAIVYVYFERRRAPGGERYRSVMKRGGLEARAVLRDGGRRT